MPSPASPCSVEITYDALTSLTVAVGAVYVEGSDIGGLPVVLTSPATGDLLQLSSGEWVNIPQSSLGVASLSTSASTGISSLSTGLSTATSGISSLSTATSTGLSTATSGIASLSTSASTGVSSLSTALSTANSNVTSLSTGLSTADSSIVSLSTSASTSISSLSTALSATNSNVTSLSTGVSTASSGIVSLSTSTSTGISSLSTGLSTTNSSVTSLSTSVASGFATGLTYSFSGGTFPTELFVRYVAPEQVSLLGTTTAYKGVWVNTVAYVGATATATTFEFTNLQGYTTSLPLPNSVVTLDLPALKTFTATGLPAANSTTIQVINFPALEYASGFTIGGRTALTTITLPAIVYLGFISASNNAALTTFTLGSTLKAVSSDVVISSGALNQASVDNILVRLAALDGTNGTASYDSKIVTITGTSSAPSATGLAAKATLVSRGCTVTHN